MNKKQNLNEEITLIKGIMGLNEGELYWPDERNKAYEEKLQTVPGVIEYLNGVSRRVEGIAKDLEEIYGETSYWHYIEPMFSGLKSVSDMEGFYTSTGDRQENVKNIIDRIGSDFNEDDMNEQSVSPTSSKPYPIFDDQQERRKSIYSILTDKGGKRVGDDKEIVEITVKLLGDSQELLASNVVAQIECVGNSKKIYVYRDNKIIANGYNKTATNYFCTAIRKPQPGTVAPGPKPTNMQGGLRKV